MAIDERTLSDDKWVRIMADYGSSGIWERGGASVEDSELPISDALKGRLFAWCIWFESSEYYLPKTDRTAPFDAKAFATEGLAIAREIKAALPDWTVIYRDVARTENEPRLDVEYEVTPTASATP